MHELCDNGGPCSCSNCRECVYSFVCRQKQGYEQGQKRLLSRKV